MSHPVTTYSFLPWLRQGLANQLTAPDLDQTVKLRAAVHVELTIKGDAVAGGTLTETVAKDVQLYGPGDIVGIESRAIVRSEPRNYITNFEPSYLPFIEFYDEDLPWRYTPAAPNIGAHRLRPWIALVVLKEDEFSEGGNLKDRPLPFVKVPNAAVFPPVEQLAAWAHVHVNGALDDAKIVSNDMNAVLPRFKATLQKNRDLAYSRIICPRRLEPNAAYHAFLMPSFESGRLAGLGLDPADAPFATFGAWTQPSDGAKPDGDLYPYYHRWYFRTGTIGDFEYLVRLLQPRPVDRRVGTRPMDVQQPGANLPPINDPDLDGILKLGGALRVPLAMLNTAERAEVQRYDQWAEPYPHPFQTSLANLINLSDDYSQITADQANCQSGLGDDVENDPDPLITPPMYGRWHALVQRLLRDNTGNSVPNNTNWVHDLNLDPRFRVAAGLGTGVVQDKQEEYMNAAWEQVGDVLEANRRIRLAQLAKEVSFMYWSHHLGPLYTVDLQQALALTAPVHKRVVTQGFTIQRHLATSLVAPAAMSAPMRRIIRPRSRLIRRLPFNTQLSRSKLIQRINDGEVSPAPPKVVPPGVITVDQLADSITPVDVPPPAVDLLRRYPWLRWTPFALIALVVLAIFSAWNRLRRMALLVLAFAAAVIAGLVALYQLLTRWQAAIGLADSIREEQQGADDVDNLPKSPDFEMSEPGSNVTPTRGTTDSAEAIRFKKALRDVGTVLDASVSTGKKPPRKRINLGKLATEVRDAINPELTIPRRTQQTVLLPPRIRIQLREQFVEAMAYPEIDEPMYRPLVNLSSELFLPNINLIEQNSITLLETNQRFIEAYMVGLNHEFARELLWREYPTDQRGSYFRQFWDVSGYLDAQGLDPEALKEKLRDIPPLHKWSRASNLGDHDNREQGGASEEEVVLVIRGELLKKYPNAVIYAHKAEWQRKPDGSIDLTKERELVKLTTTEEAKPPRTKVKTPLYEAKVDPDIFFFGFDLTVPAAKGGTGQQPTDDAGWFFVIKERPGEPRFGLDTSRPASAKINVWNDLTWSDVLPGDTPGAFIPIGAGMPAPSLVKPTGTELQEKVAQWEEDKALAWNANASSADIAYILYQAPVLVAVHAAEMLTAK